MDYTEINQLLDNAIAAVSNWATEKQSYESQIADLQSQLKTAQTTSQADENEIKTLHDKLTQLAGVFQVPVPTSTAAPTPAAS